MISKHLLSCSFFLSKNEESKKKPIRQKHDETKQHEVSIDYTKCYKGYIFGNICVSFDFIKKNLEKSGCSLFLTDITFKI